MPTVTCTNIVYVTGAPGASVAGTCNGACTTQFIQSIADTIFPVMANQTLTIDANPVNGTATGVIIATDNIGVVFMDITAGNTSGAFFLASNGTLFANNNAVITAGAVFTLTVIARDAANNTTTATVTVNVVAISLLYPPSYTTLLPYGP